MPEETPRTCHKIIQAVVDMDGLLPRVTTAFPGRVGEALVRLIRTSSGSNFLIKEVSLKRDADVMEEDDGGAPSATVHQDMKRQRELD